MAKRMTEEEVVAMLRAKIDRNEVLFMPNCGCGREFCEQRGCSGYGKGCSGGSIMEKFSDGTLLLHYE